MLQEPRENSISLRGIVGRPGRMGKGDTSEAKAMLSNYIFCNNGNNLCLLWSIQQPHVTTELLKYD